MIQIHNIYYIHTHGISMSNILTIIEPQCYPICVHVKNTCFIYWYINVRNKDKNHTRRSNRIKETQIICVLFLFYTAAAGSSTCLWFALKRWHGIEFNWVCVVAPIITYSPIFFVVVSVFLLVGYFFQAGDLFVPIKLMSHFTEREITRTSRLIQT